MSARLALASVEPVEKFALTTVGGHHLIDWRPEWDRNVETEQIWSLHELRHLLLSSDTSAPCFQDLRLGVGLRLLAPVVLRTSGLDWSYSTGFPGLPACRQHIMGLLSLYNHDSIPYNKSLYIYRCIYNYICRGQNPDKFTNVKLYCFIFSNFTPR